MSPDANPRASHRSAALFLFAAVALRAAGVVILCDGEDSETVASDETETTGLALLVHPPSARKASPAAVGRMVDFMTSRTSIAAAAMTGRPDSASDRDHISEPVSDRNPPGARRWRMARRPESVLLLLKASRRSRAPGCRSRAGASMSRSRVSGSAYEWFVTQFAVTLRPSRN